MLRIVINKFPGVQTYCDDKALLTDAFLYDLFSGNMTFQGVEYTCKDMESFISHLWHFAEGDGGFDVVLHTFNPMIVNYLEDWQARKAVFFYEGGELKPVFGGMPGLEEKLTVMGPGEAISDTIFPQEQN